MNTKKILAALLLFTVLGLELSRAEGNFVWCGLDYSKVKMIGTMDFRQPDQIFPGMLEKWNGLFMTEMMPRLESKFPGATSDLEGVAAKNAKASPSQIEAKDGTSEEMVKPSHITAADIAEEVRDYKLTHTQGTGAVFIIDRLVKAQETECLYVVFFDIATRKVLYSERVVEKAGGIGFRNFWFRPVKAAVEKLPKMYKKIGAIK